MSADPKELINPQTDALTVEDVQLTSSGSAKDDILRADEQRRLRRVLNELDGIQREMETMAARVKALKSEITSQVR